MRQFRNRRGWLVLAVFAVIASACGSTTSDTTEPADTAGLSAQDLALQQCEGKQIDFWYQTSGPEGLARFEALIGSRFKVQGSSLPQGTELASLIRKTTFL